MLLPAAPSSLLTDPGSDPRYDPVRVPAYRLAATRRELLAGLAVGLTAAAVSGCIAAAPASVAPPVEALADQLWQQVAGRRPTAGLEPLLLATATQRILGPGTGPTRVRALAGPEQLLFVLPGRRVVAFGGFFEAAPDPGLVAAAIARAQAHLETGTLALRLAAATPDSLPAPGSLFGLGGYGAPMLPWSQPDEQAAELAAVRRLAQAGFDPRLTGELWERLEAAAVPGLAHTVAQMRPAPATVGARTQLLRSLGYHS